MPDFLERLWEEDPYSMDAPAKRDFFRHALSVLTLHHYEGCAAYRAVLDAYGIDPRKERWQEDQPMIPVRLFKERELLSVPREDIVKTMTSSGTSGQAVSRIFLNKENTRSQTKALAHIISSYIGKKRLPLLILDTEQVKRDRAMFSARGAGIVGFSTFGRDVTYALDDEMRLDEDRVDSFFRAYGEEPVLMFGYTYMIWQHVVTALSGSSLRYPFEHATLFHIGGWKKLKDQAVDADSYNEAVRGVFGSVSVHNYYGMAEQLGSVFVECECGHMHCSNYSDVLVRRPSDFSVADKGERGFLELQSLLPVSYPGHVLLTEDEGEIVGVDDCPCGRKGTYFKILGRMRGAEIRGCSDTYERR